MMKATELHARLGGTLHTLSAASWALHVARWRPSTPARFDAEWELHPAERREVVVFNRRCYENRYSRAFGDQSYAYAGQVAQASPIIPETPCGELLAACNAALGSDLNSCLQNWYEPGHWLGDHRDDDDVRAMGNSAVVPSFGSSETTAAVIATRDDDGRFPQPRHPDHHHHHHHRERSASASASPRASLLGDALRQSAREDEVMKSKTSRPFGSHGSHESERVAFAFAGAFEDEVGEDAENARADAVVAFGDDAREDDEDGSRGNRHQYSSRPIDIPRSESGKGHWKTCVTLREATLREARAR